MIFFLPFLSYYNQSEVKDFENNEVEWPIFYTFLIIDGVFKSNTEQIEEYQSELRKCMYVKNFYSESFNSTLHLIEFFGDDSVCIFEGMPMQMVIR